MIFPDRLSARGKPFRVIPGNRDSRDFEMAYRTAAVLRAERDLLHERASMATLLGNDTDADRLSWIEGPAATERLKAALDRLAALPATNGAEVRWKKMAFGRVWLRTVDRYRESVERDVARLRRR
ncbi:MAG: hypothetical protein U1E43_07355 [Rhodospirillales bacterium]